MIKTNRNREQQKEVKVHCPDTPCIAIGAKCDLRNNEEYQQRSNHHFLSKEECEEKISSLGIDKYIECSAVTGENLELVFDESVRLARKHLKKLTLEYEQNKKLHTKKHGASTGGGGGGGCLIC